MIVTAEQLFGAKITTRQEPASPVARLHAPAGAAFDSGIASAQDDAPMEDLQLFDKPKFDGRSKTGKNSHPGGWL